AIFLLNSTKLSIDDISAICGYSDSNYFCRIFKNRYKLSPGQYRNNLLQK
ncbi:MAG: AraC family transcriptional regulator, partial [Lachnospiraceae bacterium]